MAEKFGVGSGPHELKIGSSFAANGKNGKFHTIRYDFKPASLDPTKSGVLDIGESNSLNVKLPHSNGTTETNYRYSDSKLDIHFTKKKSLSTIYSVEITGFFCHSDFT